MSPARTALVTLLEYDSFSCLVYLWKKPVVESDGWTWGGAILLLSSILWRVCHIDMRYSCGHKPLVEEIGRGIFM